MNKYILIVSFLSISFSIYGQDISGSYHKIDNNSSIESSTLINFDSKSSSFEEINKGHLGVSSKRIGDYAIKEDTLFLSFREPLHRDFVITKQNKIEQSEVFNKVHTNLTISTHYRDEKHSWAAIQFSNGDGNMVLGTVLDDSNTFSFYTDDIKSLAVSSLGKNDIEIDLEPILGSGAKIDIYLSKMKHENVYPKEQKFLIETMENGNLKLIPSNERDFWTLEKVSETTAGNEE